MFTMYNEEHQPAIIAFEKQVSKHALSEGEVFFPRRHYGWGIFEIEIRIKIKLISFLYFLFGRLFPSSTPTFFISQSSPKAKNKKEFRSGWGVRFSHQSRFSSKLKFINRNQIIIVKNTKIPYF